MKNLLMSGLLLSILAFAGCSSGPDFSELESTATVLHDELLAAQTAEQETDALKAIADWVNSAESCPTVSVSVDEQEITSEIATVEESVFTWIRLRCDQPDWIYSINHTTIDTGNLAVFLSE